MLRLSLILVVLLCAPAAMASDAAARVRAPETVAERMAPEATMDKAALAQRSREHHTAGRHAEALADLEKSCGLETDEQIAELCMAEVADYAKTYNLPR